MATLTIRNLDDSVRDQLRVRAAKNGRSMEAEVREILGNALSVSLPTPMNGESLYTAIREIVDPIGGIELDLPPRLEDRDPPDFS
ncbi:MAG: Arc family DNA-binding protein [Pseudomonadota bacterium]